MPGSLIRSFDSLGLFGQGENHSRLLEHFDALVASLRSYKPRAFDSLEAPTSCVIWAQEGVRKDSSDSKFDLGVKIDKSASWILDNRTDFGPNGWNILLGQHKVFGAKVAANHFTMMQEPNVSLCISQVIAFQCLPKLGCATRRSNSLNTYGVSR